MNIDNNLQAISSMPLAFQILQGGCVICPPALDPLILGYKKQNSVGHALLDDWESHGDAQGNRIKQFDIRIKCDTNDGSAICV